MRFRTFSPFGCLFHCLTFKVTLYSYTQWIIFWKSKLHKILKINLHKINVILVSNLCKFNIHSMKKRWNLINYSNQLLFHCYVHFNNKSIEMPTNKVRMRRWFQNIKKSFVQFQSICQIISKNYWWYVIYIHYDQYLEGEFKIVSKW